jgi:hypothetical protein
VDGRKRKKELDWLWDENSDDSDGGRRYCTAAVLRNETYVQICLINRHVS